MPVSDGQAVSAAVTNPAFVDAQTDDTAVGIITLANTAVASGATIVNTQRLQNRTASAAGVDEVSATGTAYTSTQRVSAATNHQAAISAIDTAFHSTTGHKHTGVAGDAPTLSGSAISGNPLKGSFLQGTDFSIGGSPVSSFNVSSYLLGKTPSTSPTVQGLPVASPNNKVIIKNWPDDDDYEDSLGNHVYGRVTELFGVWTLSFYSNIAGTETVFSMPAASPIRWYYQELFNPLTNAPVYSELATVPSDNATADVVLASNTIAGKTQLTAATPSPVAGTGSAGTANSIVSNADHVHEGVHSVKAFGNPQIKGDVELLGGSGISLAQSGQQITISSSGGTALASARYYTSSGQSIPNVTSTIVDFDTAQYDQQSNVTTGAAWKFTATKSAIYTIEVLVSIENGGGWSAGEDVKLILAKNGTGVTYIGLWESQATHTSRVEVLGVTDINLVASDYIDIRVLQSSGAAVSLLADGGANTISIRENGAGGGFSPEDVLVDENGDVITDSGGILLEG